MASALRRAVAPLALAAVLSGLVWMQWDRGGAPQPGPIAEPAGAHTIEQGVRFLVSQRLHVEPHSLFVPGHLGRRYGFAELAAFEQDFDPGSEAFGRQPVVNAMMAYAYDRGQRLEALRIEDQHPLAALLFPALHCDYLALPPDFEQRIMDATGAGGYQASHVALSLGFVSERGCRLARQDELRAAVTQLLALELQAAQEATDLSMEICAMLGYLGEARRIEPRWAEAVRGAQRPDGGWGYRDAQRSDWHHTSMALLCLLALERPETPPAPMLPSATAK